MDFNNEFSERIMLNLQNCKEIRIPINVLIPGESGLNILIWKKL